MLKSKILFYLTHIYIDEKGFYALEVFQIWPSILKRLMLNFRSGFVSPERSPFSIGPLVTVLAADKWHSS